MRRLQHEQQILRYVAATVEPVSEARILAVVLLFRDTRLSTGMVSPCSRAGRELTRMPIAAQLGHPTIEQSPNLLREGFEFCDWVW